jgi:glycosyltransferase involved in cell wall biosynthesis
MRLIQLTAGTGSFYCGTCLRDNAFVSELRRQGHDALLVPLYLPLAVDEAPATQDVPVFYGGVNVYLQQSSGLFRSTPRWVDRLLDSPAVLKLAASRAGATQAHDLGPLTLSMLRGEEGRQAKELERLVEWLAADGQPEVVCLSNALLIGLARRIKAATGAKILCFLNGEDGFLDSLPEADRRASWATIQERAFDVDAFLPVSHYYGDLMRERCGLPPERVHVVYPGIQTEGYEPPSAPPDPPVLGYLARMCADKGLGTLVEAYLLLRANERNPRLKLRVAGAQTTADVPYVAQLQERLAAAGLAQDTEFLPNVDRDGKAAFLRSLSVFSAPATYGEAFGLYVIEALASGVPVVQPRHAAFPEFLPELGGVLCEPNDPQSLATEVERLLNDPTDARARGEKGRQGVLAKFTVSRMAGEVLRIANGIAGRAVQPVA